MEKYQKAVTTVVIRHHGGYGKLNIDQSGFTEKLLDKVAEVIRRELKKKIIE